MAKILIVEDDVNLANIYKEKLTKGGHSAKVVVDMDAAKEILATKPNLVLLDILMPHVSGLDILKLVKADAKGASIPILLLTNVAEDTTIAKGLELGAYGYLLKSETTPEQVLSRVNMTLEETSPAKP
ncbi:response regulator transcription factor [Candidatus Curtissbacteria bacterium]|nr:response regulator transcription factor [Candidatus Curtissbacteria bacterium]